MSIVKKKTIPITCTSSHLVDISRLRPIQGKFLLNIGGSQYRFDIVVNEICEILNLKVKEVFKYKIGKGDILTQKFSGDKLENTIKANDLFFEVSK